MKKKKNISLAHSSQNISDVNKPAMKKFSKFCPRQTVVPQLTYKINIKNMS